MSVAQGISYRKHDPQQVQPFLEGVQVLEGQSQMLQQQFAKVYQQQQTTQAAATATLTAATAAEASSSAGNSMISVVDIECLGRPEVWHGEEKKWRDWKLVLRAYLMALHHRRHDLLTRQESMVTGILWS